MDGLKWITFSGREFENDTDPDFKLIAVPVARVYAIQEHGTGCIVQLLPASDGAEPIRMETTYDLTTMLGKVG